MGFSGGGTNILKAHKHTSAVQDGGKLDMDNVTEAELTQGDVIFSDGNALQRLSIGVASDALLVNGAATAPEWGTLVTGATVTKQDITPTNGQTTTSNNVWEDVANASITLPTRAGGIAFISGMATMLCNASTNVGIGLYHDGGLQEMQQLVFPSANVEYSVSVTGMQALDGSEVKMQWKGGPGTKTMVDAGSYYSSRLQTYEVS
jgi:hypothetical protein